MALNDVIHIILFIIHKNITNNLFIELMLSF